MAEQDTEDYHPTNMLVRAGYLEALARSAKPGTLSTLTTSDREVLLQASRSLRYAAKVLSER